jgi:hypothetical protein
MPHIMNMASGEVCPHDDWAPSETPAADATAANAARPSPSLQLRTAAEAQAPVGAMPAVDLGALIRSLPD